MAKKSEPAFAIGVDYGTNSVRALVVDIADGREVATHVYDYPSGESGILLDPKDPHTARQNPADYIEGFFRCVGCAVKAAASDPTFRPERVVGIGVDTTGSTPIPVDRSGRPLALLPEFAHELSAHAWLWKDHTGYAEAAEITEKARRVRDRYLNKCGGTYSSEWYWSKILHCKRSSPKVFQAAYSWVELADFVPAFITGNLDPETLPRGICAAGHKAMYHEDWQGLPSAKFLGSLDPELAVLRDHYAARALTSDRKAGSLTAEVAAKVGLPAGVAVAVGAFDAHMGAVGAGIKAGTLVKIIGTSTCDMMVAPLAGELPDIPGLCGIVPGSILPNMYGLEAGQSAVGDIFNWFVKSLGHPAGTHLWVRVGSSLRPTVTLVTEFIAIQAGGLYFGLPAWLSVALGAALVFGSLAFRRYVTWERALLGLAAFNLLFVPAALFAHPDGAALGHALATWGPLKGGFGKVFLTLVLANIGATVTPWMIFFQQSAVVDKGLTRADLPQGRMETGIGAVLAAAAAVATLVAAAPLFAAHVDVSKFASGADFASALRPLLGTTGATLFALGILEAGLVAAMTISTSSSYSLAETVSARHSLNLNFTTGRLFYGTAILSTLLAAGIVLIPGAPLLAMTLTVNVIATLLMAPALLLLLLLANDREIMGELANGRLANLAGGTIVAAIAAVGALYGVLTAFPALF